MIIDLNYYYDPKPNKYPYPEYTDKHFLDVNTFRGYVFDKDYPYIDYSKSFRFKKWVVRVLLVCIVFPMTRIKLGLKIVGRKNIKRNSALLSNGAITVCNHVHMWDYICVMKAIRPHKPYLLSWNKNINGKDGPLVRLVGGIPIPENDESATIAYFKAIKKMLNDRGWLHIYPEGSMWDYYRPIRPFKRGAAFFAVTFDKPLIPLAISYRKPGWVRRKIFKQIALLTLHIGEPLLKNKQLSPKEQEEDLLIRAHASMCDMVGIYPNESIYPPIFNNTRRVDY